MDQRPIRQLRSVLDSTDYSSLESGPVPRCERCSTVVASGTSTPHHRVAGWRSSSRPCCPMPPMRVSTRGGSWSRDATGSSTSRSASTTCSTRATTSTHRSPRIASPTRTGSSKSATKRDETIARGDVVVLHDPQTAGLAPTLVEHGATVVWRCHVGIDAPGPLARGAWDLLREDVAAADTRRCSRAASYAWDGLRSRPHLGHGAVHRRRVGQEPPAGGGRRRRDAPPQRDLRRQTATAGAQTRPRSSSATDQQPRVASHAGRASSTTSRFRAMRRWWSRSRAGIRLKDPVGLMHAFVDTVLPTHDDAHLVLAGPETEGVDDDPESALVFGEVREDRQKLPPAAARTRASRRAPDGRHRGERCDGQCAPSGGLTSSSRRAWPKASGSRCRKPCGRTGPRSEAGWAASRTRSSTARPDSPSSTRRTRACPSVPRCVRSSLDPTCARQLGRAAHQRVCDRFTPVHHYADEATLLEALVGAGAPGFCTPTAADMLLSLFLTCFVALVLATALLLLAGHRVRRSSSACSAWSWCSCWWSWPARSRPWCGSCRRAMSQQARRPCSRSGCSRGPHAGCGTRSARPSSRLPDFGELVPAFGPRRPSAPA